MAWWDDESGGGGDLARWGRIVADFDARLAKLRMAGYTTLSSRRRTALENARVQGAAMSQHLVGTAADFVIRRDQVEAFSRAARAQRLIVVNEMNRPGHGAHMHVQMFPAGRVPSFAPFPRPLAVQITEVP